MNLILKIFFILVSNTHLINIISTQVLLVFPFIVQIELGRRIMIYLFLSSFKDASMAIMYRSYVIS